MSVAAPEALTAAALWHGLALPLSRLLVSVSVGLFVGTLIEALHWTRAVAKVAQPLVRLGRLKDVAGASFSLAFFSGAAANAMLAEAHDKGEMSRREVVLANLFNSLPTYFLHLPTLFFIAAPSSAGRRALRRLTVAGPFCARSHRGPGPPDLPPCPRLRGLPAWSTTPSGTARCTGQDLARFTKRLPRMVFYTVPI
jgi:hypothetical protein